MTTGLVLLTASIGVGIYLLLRDKETDDKSSDNNPFGGTGSAGGNTGGTDTATDQTDSTGQITPQYNAENELKNSIGELKGRVLFPKREWAGGWGYANVRTSPEVNTNQGWWDGMDNLVTTINEGTPIGEVLEDTRVDYNGYNYRWFKVKLMKPVGFWFPVKEGYVRADTVTIKPYTP